MRNYILFVYLLLFCSCFAQNTSSIIFNNLDRDVDAINSDNVPAELSIRIANPTKESENYDAIVGGIKDLIRHSKVGKELNLSNDGTLEEIVDSYENYFPIGISEGELEPGCRYNLWIEYKYQNSKCVIFLVSDGIYGNGGPMEHYYVLRLSDGHIMQRDEMVNISEKDVIKLAQTYADDEEEINPYDLTSELYNFSPCADGCLLQYPIGSHFSNEIIIPMDAISAYLTDEGKELLFSAFGNQASNKELVLSKNWWRRLANKTGITDTNNNSPLIAIFILTVVGLILLNKKYRLLKMSLVVIIGILEIYYFNFHTDSIWFYEGESSWYVKLFALCLIVATLVIQCKLTDEILIDDSLDGDKRYAADSGMISVIIIAIAAIAWFLQYAVSSWLGLPTPALIVGYLSLIVIIVLLARLIKVNQVGNYFIICLLCTFISLSGVIVTMFYCWGTGIIAFLISFVISSKNNQRSVVYANKIKAEEGDIDSVYKLGRHYLNGTSGLAINPQKAVECFKKVAENGNARAYIDLAECYLTGRGVSKDWLKAIDLGKKSLRMGNEDAKTFLGILYYDRGKAYHEGNGLPHDEEKAVEMYKISGEYGYAKAYSSLSRRYMEGIGVQMDGNKGLEMAMKAYNMGYINACVNISAYYRMGKFIPEDYVNGHKWDMIGAKAGIPVCQIRVAIDYEQGYGGVQKNYTEAARWYKKVIDNNKTIKKDLGYACWKYASMQFSLGNDSEGEYYVRKAASHGNKHAQDLLDAYNNQS